MAARRLAGWALLSVLALLAANRARAEEPTEDPGEDELAEVQDKQIQSVISAGGHSGATFQMVFDREGTSLYTVGAPGDVQEWDVNTGERLRVWRFPHPALRLALAPDGRYLAVGCKGAPPDKGGKPLARVWLVDRQSGRARVVAKVGAEQVQQVAFSPGGDRLAVNAGPDTTIVPLTGDRPEVSLPRTGRLLTLAFDPSGTRLLTARLPGDVVGAQVRVFSPGAGGPARMVPFRGAEGTAPMAAWSPSGKRLATFTGRNPAIRSPEIHFWTVSDRPGEPDWSVDSDELIRQFGSDLKGGQLWSPLGIAFRTEDEAVACWETAGWMRVLLLDVARRKIELLPQKLPRQSHTPGMALSQDHRFLAAAILPSYDLVVYDLERRQLRSYRDPESGKQVTHFGPPVHRPAAVGWTEDGSGIVWSYRLGIKESRRKEIPFRGFDLAKLEPLPEEKCTEVAQHGLAAGWKLDHEAGRAVLDKGEQKVALAVGRVNPLLTRRFEDSSSGKALLVLTHDHGAHLSVIDPDTGKIVRKVGETFFPVYDVAVSPNGRYLLVAGGGQSVSVYDLANPGEPLLDVLTSAEQWIVWTPQGYYASTPGGERLMSWKVNGDEEHLPVTYPAQAFRQKFWRPDVISRLLAEGSVAAALKKTQTDAVARSVEDQPPPRVRLRVDPPEGKEFTVEVEAESAAADQPIQGLQLLADGRPLPGDQGVERLREGRPSCKARWTVSKLPGGKVELKVKARCPDVYGFSEPTEVRVPEDPENRPALHVVAVGLNYEDTARLTLHSARNDATCVARAFPEACVGPLNLFGQAPRPHLLLERDATTANVCAALADVRRRAKPGDLVVFFYAGHGVREGGEFFLLTSGADLKDLRHTALSGHVLREELAGITGKVLVVLDACHSGQAGAALQGLEPATDEASRQLTDDDCAVALLAAALGRESARERQGASNGMFTTALLSALKRQTEVTYNRRDGRQYVHHLFAEVHDEVRDESNGRQHPFLALPVAEDSFPVRRVSPGGEGSK